MINNPLAYASNNTHVSKILSQINLAVMCEANSRRRGGLIVNNSRYTLHFFLGENPPTDRSKFLQLPYAANADVPFMYVGRIWGYWDVTDEHGAIIHEFYGDFQ